MGHCWARALQNNNIYVSEVYFLQILSHLPKWCKLLANSITST
jgi:hypothetical protein